MESYINTNKEKGEERHHAICDHCGKLVYPDARNIFLWFGFNCMDTGMFISNDCKKDYYIKKNAGHYGKEHAHKYSEFPVMVPWTIDPTKYKKPIEVITDPKNPLQFQFNFI
jgi:hypothetical protein